MLAADERSFATAADNHTVRTAAVTDAQLVEDAAERGLAEAKAASDDAACARDAHAQLRSELQLLAKKQLKLRAEECEGIAADAVAAACREEEPQPALVALIVQCECPPNHVVWEAADIATAEAQRALENAKDARCVCLSLSL